MAYVKRLVDRVIATDLGCPDLEFVWSADREFDPLTAARIDDLALRNGSRTVNEVRDRVGLDTLPGGDQPMVLTPTGHVPLTPQPLGKGYFIEDQHPCQPLGSPRGIGGARLQLVAGGGAEGGDEESSGLRSRRDGLLEELLDPGAALRVERYSETFADLQRLSPGGLNGPTLSYPNFIPNQEDIEKLGLGPINGLPIVSEI
jgi:hypothetical protein